MDERAQIVEITPYLERSTNELFNYGVLGILAVLFILGVVFIVRWAFRKIDEAQTKQDALHTFYAEKLDAKERAHTVEMQRIQDEFRERMEEITKDFKQVVLANTQAWNDVKAELMRGRP